MRFAFFLWFLTLAAGCIVEDKPIAPPGDGGVDAGDLVRHRRLPSRPPPLQRRARVRSVHGRRGRLLHRPRSRLRRRDLELHRLLRRHGLHRPDKGPLRQQHLRAVHRARPVRGDRGHRRRTERVRRGRLRRLHPRNRNRNMRGPANLQPRDERMHGCRSLEASRSARNASPTVSAARTEIHRPRTAACRCSTRWRTIVFRIVIPGFV